jgi:uncharacterized membrane protein YuzA (DUF378 family)
MRNITRKWYECIAYIILIIGGLNWGFTAFDFNLIEKIISMFYPTYSITFAYFKTIAYFIIGLASIYVIYLEIKLLKK